MCTSEKRLQQYAGLAAAVLATAAPASDLAAQINHIDVDPDANVFATTYSLDVNGDGVVDFVLSNNYGSTFSNWNKITPVGSNEVVGVTSYGGPWGGPYYLAAKLDYGDVIDGDQNWQNRQLVFNSRSVSLGTIGQWDDENGIAGLRFKVGSDWHYGFVRVFARTGFISGDMDVLNYSWNGNPNGAIAATDFGLCEAPTGLTATQITPTKFELSWDPATTLNKYQLFYRKVGDPSSLEKKSTPYNSRVISGLDPGTAYEWTARVRCPENMTSPIAGAFSFTTPAPRHVELPKKTVSVKDKPALMRQKE